MKGKNSKVHLIVFIGLFSAISMVLTRLLSFYPIPTIRISFGDIPIMLSGALFGPYAGGVTGMLSDLLGTMLFPAPTGAIYFPGFTLSKALVGIIPAMIFRMVKGSNVIKTIMTVVITEIICSLTLDTIWLSMLYNKGVLILLPSRIVVRAVIAAIEIPVIIVVIKALDKIDPLNLNGVKE